MSTGIAAAGRVWRDGDNPVPLPVQALDHTTGYLMAAAAAQGLSVARADCSAFDGEAARGDRT
jgi:hypothetical protein